MNDLQNAYQVSQQLGMALLKELGLDDKPVASLTITISGRELPTVTVVTEECPTGGEFLQLVKRYRLKPDLIPAADCAAAADEQKPSSEGVQAKGDQAN